MSDFKAQLNTAAARLGLKIDPADNTNPATVEANNATTVANLRAQYGTEALADYTDEQLLVTYADWSMSDDYENVDTLLVWLEARYKPQPKSANPDEAIVDTAAAEATVEAVIEPQPDAQPVPEAAVDPIDTNPEPATLDDFTPRQHLAVLTELLRARRTEELTHMMADLLGSVSRMQITTETDAIVVITENAKLTDYVLAIFRLLDVAPLSAKIDRHTLQVADVRVDFNRKSPRFSLVEIEAGMIAAFKAIHDMRNLAATVPNLNKQLEARTADIQTLNTKLEAANKAKEAAEQRTAMLEAQPKAVPLTNAEGDHFAQVRWLVDMAKEGEAPKPTMFYLTVEEGAEPNEKGIFKTAVFRRTKDRQKAITFSSVQEARDTIARMLKNSKHLDKKSKVTERALKNANVVQLMELEG